MTNTFETELVHHVAGPHGIDVRILCAQGTIIITKASIDKAMAEFPADQVMLV
jgi:hypothetical protein